MRIHSAVVLAVFAATLFSVPTKGDACPSCKNTLSSEEKVNLARVEFEMAMDKLNAAAATNENKAAMVAAARAEAKLREAEQNMAVTRGYFWSILFMMTAPYLILGALFGSIYFAFKRAMKRKTLIVGGQQLPA